MAREIVLDTETTGLYPKDGHRVVEIACVEIDDCIPTGRIFHRYLHPERDIDADAERVHGISLASLADAPKFETVVDEFLEFVGDCPLIAHNAPFDRGFINAELERLGRAPTHEMRWIDTLAMAQKRFPGMFNSLDALCKRFKISLEGREKHGAVIDTRLLAEVYLELRGGRAQALDLAIVVKGGPQRNAAGEPVAYGARPRPLASRVSLEEAAVHAAFVEQIKDAVWMRLAS